MKKKFLSTLLVIVTTASILIGCGTEETNVKEDNIQTSENQVAESADKEYSPLEDIEWFWSISNHDLYTMMVDKEEVNPELFVGTISYDDGTMGSIKPDEVTLEQDGEQMLIGIEYRGDIFYYKANIHERWGDGEHLSEEEIETFKQEEPTRDNAVVNGFSSNDAPELDIDWSLFNSVLSERVIGKEDFYSLYSDLFGVVGSDVRVDWGVVNDNFSLYYGNTRDGLYDFGTDLYDSYCNKRDELSDGSVWISALALQPYADNTDTGIYDGLHYEFKNKYSAENGDDGLVSEEVNIVNQIMGEAFKGMSYDERYVIMYAQLIVNSKRNSLVAYERTKDEYDENLFYRCMKEYDSRIKDLYPDNYESYRISVENALIDENDNTLIYSDFLK